MPQIVVQPGDTYKSSRPGDGAPRTMTQHLWIIVAADGLGLVKGVVQNHGFELSAIKCSWCSCIGRPCSTDAGPPACCDTVQDSRISMGRNTPSKRHNKEPSDPL